MGDYSEKREWQPVEEREKDLIEKLKGITKHAYEKAPAIKKRFDEAGFHPSQIKSLEDLEKIPITTRDEYIKIQRENPPFGGFLTVPYETLKRIYVHPGPQYETLADTDIEHAQKVLWKVGARRGDIVINAVTYHIVPAGLLVDDILTSMGVTVIPTGFGNTDLQIQIMHDLKATIFVGFPLFFMTIIKRAEELGYDLKRDFHIRRALALGSSPVRRSLEEDYNIDTREVYAYLPVGIPACECDEKSGMHIEEDFIIEIVDPATGRQVPCGETGELVVTTTFNNILPRIRIGSGDLSSVTDKPCPCGRTSYRIPKILGRVGEGVKIRGMFVHPIEVEDVVSKIPGISRFHIICTHENMKDLITAKLELNSEDIDKDAITESFMTDFQSRCRLRVNKVEFVPKGTIPDDAKKVEDLRKEVIL
ncbi:MAG: hypothetical protein AB1401_11950 [Thermodesulfobacteriota bacterium]